ncbi:MAG: hypothetical protein ABIE94_01935 [archaeon]
MKLNNKKIIGISIMVALILTLVFALVYAIPGGPTISYQTNSTKNTSGPTNRTNDDGGYITTMNLDLAQQTEYWKAYVGNVSGSITLDDSSSYTIYDWTLTTITGEVYATRASSTTWSNVQCANDAAVTAEQNFLNMTVDQIYNVNNTFNYSDHKSFIVAGKNITADSCWNTALHINDTGQTVTGAAAFQQIILQDGTDVIYTTIIENNAYGYNNMTYDYQLIVGEAESNGNALTHYFYVELG